MKTLKIAPPYMGLDEIAPEDDMPAGKGPTTSNFLPGRSPHQLTVRGGVLNGAAPAALFSKYAQELGAWTHQDRWLCVSPTGTVSTSDGFTGSFGGVSSLSHGFVQLEEYSVGPLGSGAQLFCWTPSGAGIGTGNLVANGPTFPIDLVGHLGRVFVLAGTKPGTGTYSASSLYWTDPYPDLRLGLLSSWQDDLSGLTNELKLPAQDQWIDVVSVGQVLYIIGRRSVLAMYGDDPTQFTIRKVLDTGCSSNLTSAALATNNGFYFFSRDGLGRYEDGAWRIISGPIADSIQNALVPGADVVASLCPLGDGYISVLIPTESFQPGRNAWFIYHEATGSWARLSTSNTGTFETAPVLVRQLNGTVKAFYASQAETEAWVNDITYFTKPGHVDAATTDTGWQIQAGASSPILRLAMPGRRAQVHSAHASTRGFGDDPAWTIGIAHLVDGTSGSFTLLAPPNPTMGGNAGIWTTGHSMKETESLQVTWSYSSDDGPDGVPVWVGDVVVDYEPAQQR